LAEALRRIVAQRIHMLWVVSSDFKPVGSLHTSDIFKLFGKGTLNPAV
jgi:predicted transcriptional regulator